MFTSTSFARWTKVAWDNRGHTFYVDFDRIKKHDVLVYFWYLDDYLKPDKFGDLSVKSYRDGDCNLFWVKTLSS